MYGKETWVNAKAMRSQGMSYDEIARALGINKRTAMKLCSQKEIPIPAPRERALHPRRLHRHHRRLVGEDGPR